MASKDYDLNVFVNCPFDSTYEPLRDAIVFAIYDCGYIPRCALEEDNSGNVRFEKIQRLIKDSRYGVHDISRTALDPKTKLPRFNMPLELGVFIGAQKFGIGTQKEKNCLILDIQPYRYNKFISDIAGHDIKAHKNQPFKVIQNIRDWLSSATKNRIIPGGAMMVRRYKKFQKELPKMCDEFRIKKEELTYNDYSNLVSEWLKLADSFTKQSATS